MTGNTIINNPQKWRLIPYLSASGQVQMSIDSWLLQQHSQGLYPPTLRFYTWEPVAISLGYHQKKYPENWENLTYHNIPIDLVRRPSGGRAVLHQGDLTYAIITSNLPGNRHEIYQKICQFLIEGWRSLGVELYYGSAKRAYIHKVNCFEIATNADLVLPDGTKFIGSAQLRKGKAILQHGSMRLQPDADLFYQIFGESTKPPNLPLLETEEPLKLRAIKSLTQAASRCFNIEFETQDLPEHLLSNAPWIGN